jgi:hypothetical protein
MDLVLTRKINPGKVFDLTLPLADVAEGYKAMDERRAIKTMLRLTASILWRRRQRQRHRQESPDPAVAQE